MRKLLVTCVLLLFISYINAQVVENPVFDRTDVPSFRVAKVELSEDTTYVYCIYNADDSSWANISDKTYLENVRNGDRFPILKVSGIPFSPETRHFTNAEEVGVILYFPPLSADKINIIENERENAFNIYGIDLTQSYVFSYTSEDIYSFFIESQKEKEEENWDAALKCSQKQLEATNYIEGISSFASACSIYNMIMVYFRLEEYGKIIEWGKKAIDILRELPQDSIYLDVLARTYGNVGTAYRLLKEPEVASEYMELSLATRRLKEGVGRLNYEEYLREMAKNYYYEENYPRALLYGKEVVDIYKKKYSESPNKYECVYISSLNNLCAYYHAMGKAEEAIICGKLTLELYNKGGCDDNSWLKQAICHNLALAFLSNGQTDEGIGLLEVAVKEGDYDRAYLNARLQLASAYLYYKQDSLKALNEYKAIKKVIEDSITIGKNDYPIYSKVLDKLFEIQKWNNPVDAMQYLNKAIMLHKEWFGEKSIAYANMLLKKVYELWIPSLHERTNLDSLVFYMQDVANIVKKHFNNSLPTMSITERKDYWQRYESFFTWLIPTISGMIDADISNSLAYDAALFYKGILLSSERDFKNAVQASNNKELYDIFLDYTNNLATLERIYSENVMIHAKDSLESLIHEQEYLLSQKVTRFNQQYKGTDFTWKEIKSQLKKGDVAIEILSYLSIDASKTYYDAYVINNESKAPMLVHLCSEDRLKSLTTDSIDYKGLSNLLWGNERLHEAIKDANNIFFSTSGMLNTIGIEYLPLEGDQFIYDKFNLYRLSSTRELCLRNGSVTIDKACLYGGLDFDYTAPQLKTKEKVSDRLSRSAVELLSQRGGFEYLNGSMEEVKQIKSVISKKGIDCVLFSKSEGTEESFKELSGSHTGILHLSTHGMYIPDGNEDMRETKNYRFIISDEMQNVDDEDKSLSRSFLVLAGGNALIHRDSISVENEDGILTALEISRLDFTNLDLVVLSACETALGRIDTEGVYGLQRGFKKAGVNTILMSLDKVDDEATRILMVEFYRNLMNGKTKRQSLKDAQQYLRKVDNGKYDAPKYWASFIMLDGID